jgi:SmpA / OmlA family
MSVLRPPCCLIAVLAGCLAVPTALSGEPFRAEVDPHDKVAQLRPGMTAAQVQDLVGRPRHVARQILYARYLEQWTYDDPISVRIEFDWRKGQERQILTVQPLSTPAR